MKAVVLFSGGLDSTTCLAKAIECYGKEEVLALSIDYGQKHEKELEAADKIVKYYHVQHQILDLKKIFEKSNCSLLEGSKEEIPLESYQSQIRKNGEGPLSTYVPFRNGLFLSVCASIALSVHADVIYYGAHADDAVGNAYPDTSFEFNQSMSDAIWLGSGKQVKVVAPFINKTKAEVVQEGLQLKVPYELTWSCYEGHAKACGKCGTCQDRIKAFKENGVQDPIEYEVQDAE